MHLFNKDKINTKILIKHMMRIVVPVFVLFSHNSESDKETMIDIKDNIESKIKVLKHYLPIEFENIFINSKYIFVDEIEYMSRNVDEGRCIIQNTVDKLDSSKDSFTNSPHCLIFMFILYLYFFDKFVNNNKKQRGGNINIYNLYTYNKMSYLKIKYII